MTNVPFTWGSSISRYQSISCEGSYVYSEDEVYSGQKQLNVTVTGNTSLGAYASTPRTVTMSPWQQQQQAYAYINYWCNYPYGQSSEQSATMQQGTQQSPQPMQGVCAAAILLGLL